jgi:predicted dinucleotide-binding enzyme
MRNTVRRRFLYLASAAVAACASQAWAQAAPIPVRPYKPPNVGHPIAKTAKPLKLGIIGSGNVGGNIGQVWSKAGHHVMFSDRDPAIAKTRAGENPGATSGTPAEAIAYADVVVVAIPFGAWPEFAREYGAALKNKIMLEFSNPNLTRDGAVGEAGLAKGSGAYVAGLLPGVKIARSASAMSAAMLSSEAARPAPRLAIPVMADDAAAKAAGLQLINDAGFDAIDGGALSRAPKFAMGTPGGAVMTAADLRAWMAANP